MLALVAALTLHLLEKRLMLAQAPLAPPAPVMPSEPPTSEPPPAPYAPPPDVSPAAAPVTPAEPLVIATPPRDLHLVDVNKNAFAGGEVGIGILGAFGVTVGSTVAGVLLLASCGGVFCRDATGPALVWFLSWYVLEPLVVAGAEAWFGNTPRAGSVAKSIGFGFAAEGVELLLGVALTLASPVVGVLVILAGQFLAVPLAASLGLHVGDEALGPNDPLPVGLSAVPSVGPGR
ncbi:MAG: hypothetical protein JST54_23815 [Deltaproteobacteria bacterium]|nr:hypothetical protein [Deltaproteobacteria bacterium]